MHYLFLASITIILWSSLALVVTQLSHVPPFFLLSISLLVGGCFSLAKVRQWHWSLPTATLGVFGLFGYHFLLFMALRTAPALGESVKLSVAVAIGLVVAFVYSGDHH